jgi:TonB family protein
LYKQGREIVAAFFIFWLASGLFILLHIISPKRKNMIRKYRSTLSFTSLLISAVIFTACESQDYKKDDPTTPSKEESVSPDESSDRMAEAATPGKRGKVSITAERNITNTTSKTYRKDANGVYDQVEVQPEFPGGDNALSSYVETNLVYPENAVDRNVEGTVRVQFVVDEKGNVRNPQVAGQKNGQGLEEAAIEVVKKMPAWKPGQVNGRNVKTKLVLPITYRLE